MSRSDGEEPHKGDDDGVKAGEIIAQAQAIAEISPIRALLSPSAEFLGRHLRDKVERWIGAKQKENLEKHAQAVLTREMLDHVSDQSQIDLFSWADKAQNITDEDEELSAAAQAALESIVRNRKAISDSIMSMTRDEILYIKDFPQSKFSPNIINKLKEKDLIDDFSIFRLVSISINIQNFIIYIITIILSYIFMSFILLFLIASAGSDKISVILFIFTLVIPLLIIGIVFKRAKLTNKGKEVKDLIEKYLSTRKI